MACNYNFCDNWVLNMLYIVLKKYKIEIQGWSNGLSQ